MGAPRNQIFLAILVAVVAAVVSSSLTFYFAQGSSAQIRARSIAIMDDSGQEVALLSANNGAPELALFDKAHTKRESIFLEKNGTPDFYLYDSQGTPRAALDLLDSGIPDVGFASMKTKDAFVSLSSPTGQELQVSLRQGREGKTQIQGVLELSAQDGHPQLRLLDGNKQQVWETPSKALSVK